METHITPETLTKHTEYQTLIYLDMRPNVKSMGLGQINCEELLHDNNFPLWEGFKSFDHNLTLCKNFARLSVLTCTFEQPLKVHKTKSTHPPET